jgi:hypothetical protein
MSNGNYDNNMRGVLFKNSEKKSDRSPDYLGKIEIENVEYQLSAWINVSKAGAKYMALTVSLPKTDSTKPVGGGGFHDDEIPFAPEVR